MSPNQITRLTVSIGFGIALFTVLLIGMAGATAPHAAPLRQGVSRPHDPVIVSGADLPAFTGVPIAELALYARKSGAWQPVPFQIDEVTASGLYTTTEDRLLDENDELVFMGKDAGESMATTVWVADDLARLNVRYVITVTDPLQPGDVGVAVLYRSNTLTRTGASYVGWNEAMQTVTAVSYTLAFDLGRFIGLADLSINGSTVDIMDRQKTRIHINNPFPFPDITLTEEDLVAFLGTPLSISLPIVGPVRAVGGDATSGFGFYAGRIDVDAVLPLSQIGDFLPGVSVDSLRLSIDMNDPAVTGMAPAVYYDNNTPAGLPIDGVVDAVSASPPLSWTQTSGSLGGMVVVLDVDPGVDILSNYYKDDGNIDSNDTGDQRSFADAGFLIERSGGTVGDITMTHALYILPPSAGNVGDRVATWASTPLVASVAVQTFGAALETYLPIVIRP